MSRGLGDVYKRQLEYGYNIPEVTGAVQDKVKNAIETMTGLSVEDVNIRVAGVNLEDE